MRTGRFLVIESFPKMLLSKQSNSFDDKIILKICSVFMLRNVGYPTKRITHSVSGICLLTNHSSK